MPRAMGRADLIRRRTSHITVIVGEKEAEKKLRRSPEKKAEKKEGYGLVGQKVNPKGLRLGIVRDWEAKWFADKKNFADLLIEDVKIQIH